MTADEDDERGKESPHLVRERFGHTVVGRLLDQTGLSTREFEQRHGTDHSRVSYYRQGRRMPPLPFMEDLVRDARTLGGVSDEEAEDAFRSYRAALDRLVELRPSDPMYQLMLRIYDLTMELSEVNGDLEVVRKELRTVREREAELQAQVDAGRQLSGAGDEDAGGEKPVLEGEVLEETVSVQLHERGAELATRQADLLHRQTTLTGELREYEARYRALDGVYRTGVAPRQHLRRTALALGVVAVLAVATAAVLLFALRGLPPISFTIGDDSKPSKKETPRQTPSSEETSKEPKPKDRKKDEDKDDKDKESPSETPSRQPVTTTPPPPLPENPEPEPSPSTSTSQDETGGTDGGSSTGGTDSGGTEGGDPGGIFGGPNG